MKADISRKTLQELLDYDPDTGAFRWKVSVSNVKAGTMAGVKRNGEYETIGINSTYYQAHRLAWLHFYGEWPDGIIDHINRDKSDNRISNLRIVTRAENMANSKLNKRNISGINGVTFNKASAYRWKVQVTTNGKQHYLGHFFTISAAKEAIERFHKLGVRDLDKKE